MKTALVIMAAGIGSRFGAGIKQLEPVGPSGEIIMEYSIHDALEAGFDKVVFIVRKEIAKLLKEAVGDKAAEHCEVAYAYQEIDSLPEGYKVPIGRTKPWGTGQAILCAKDVLDCPFCVINADDYYGKEGFRKIHEALTEEAEKREGGVMDIYMAGFILRNTLSDNGGVTRGVCRTDDEDRLIGIDETKNIIRTEEGAAVMTDDGLVAIDPETKVSMNLWGFPQSFLAELEDGFPTFLENLGDNAVSAEYLLPSVVDEMIKEKTADVHVLRSDDTWFGVTYQEDKESVKEAFANLVNEGVYQTPLF